MKEIKKDYKQSFIKSKGKGLPFENIGGNWILKEPIQSRDYAQDKSGFKIDPNNLRIDVFGKAVNVKTSEANAITIDYGSDILLKHGGDIKFTSVDAPGACVGALAGVAGNVDDGAHIYKITFVNDAGETELGVASNTVTVADKSSDGQVSLTNMPVSTSSSVTSRRIYRTQAGGAAYFLLATISDNTTTTYTDNIADSSLGGFSANNILNSSYGKIIIDDIVCGDFGSNNVLLGQNAGIALTTGHSSVALGFEALKGNLTGGGNIAIGYKTLLVSTLSNNTAIGQQAMLATTNGYDNTSVGSKVMISNTTGRQNSAFGYEALNQNDDGIQNTAIGNGALYTNITGDGNVAVGFLAGYYETGSNKLFIDNTNRTNEADGRTKALIYGVFAATTAAQFVRVNANLGIQASAFGTSADGVLGIANGTVPSSSPADMIQIFSTDISGGDATLGLRTEVAVAADVDETKFSNKLPVKINGTTYYIMLTVS